MSIKHMEIFKRKGGIGEAKSGYGIPYFMLQVLMYWMWGTGAGCEGEVEWDVEDMGNWIYWVWKGTGCGQTS